MCVFIYIYIYIINVHSTVHTHILCKQKLLFWMRLIEINRSTALIYVHILLGVYLYRYYILLFFFIVVNINILGYFQGKNNYKIQV